MSFFQTVGPLNDAEKHWTYLTAGAFNRGEEHVKGYSIMDELTICSEELDEDKIKSLAKELEIQP